MLINNVTCLFFQNILDKISFEFDEDIFTFQYLTYGLSLTFSNID